uniref:WKF domain-containing protein n=1 Tax=Geospiza parvula TaxID=87175 RepID=A0A8C3M9J2_GEOPR
MFQCVFQEQHFRMPKMIVEKKEKKAEKRKKLKEDVAQKDELELETKPKKKKKQQKLQATKEEEELIAEEEEELTPEEKRKLERKLKKERKKKEKQLMREAGIPIKKVEPKKPSGCERALAYLTSWSKNPEEWKFQKTRQTWLLLHMYDKEKVPDKYFTILLDYLQGLQGNARDKTVQKAEAFMKEFDGSDGEDPNLLGKCERIRQVLQLLS